MTSKGGRFLLTMKGEHGRVESRVAVANARARCKGKSHGLGATEAKNIAS